MRQRVLYRIRKIIVCDIFAGRRRSIEVRHLNDVKIAGFEIPHNNKYSRYATI